MNNIIVQRRWETSQSITGQLSWGSFNCYTLEPARTNPVNAGHPAIIAGTFDVEILYSKKFKRLMPHVMNVPGRDAIEIHWGNRPADTEGCTVLGTAVSIDWVSHSQVAFDAFFNLLQDWFNDNVGQKLTITYLDPAS